MQNSRDLKLKIGFMNIKGQSGLGISKQKQIEDFIRKYDIDILNCQEIYIVEDSFDDCPFISSNFQ